MRCDAVRKIIEEGITRAPAVEVHVESCASCRAYERRWGQVQAGLVALRAEVPPEPTLGFTTRMMRRLQNASPEFQFGQQLIDQIGMRVVYATLMVALMVGLILALPSSGPLRSSGISESVFVQTQVATVANEQILGVDGMDPGDMQDTSAAPAQNGSPAVRGSK